VSRAHDARAAALAAEARLQNGRGTADGFRRAIELSQAALARDPRDAEANAELAFGYIRLPDDDATVDRQVAYQRAQTAAQRALDIDPDSWRAHSTMGFIEYGYHWNFVAGVRHFREVIRINPSRGPGHNQLGLALLDMGDVNGALTELALSSRLEASSPFYRAFYAQAQYVAGDRETALATWRQILADNPNMVVVRQMILDDALTHGDWHAAALQEAQIRRLRHDPTGTKESAAFERVLATGDRRAIFKTMLKGALAEVAAGRAGEFQVARIYGLFGDRDAALDALKKALESRDPEAIAMRVDPLLASVRDDPRFEQLATTYGITPSALREAS
jgi:tetratricopeptide (TPR) repeat protein